MRRLTRVALGAVLAGGLLTMMPAAVLGAQPACGAVLTTHTTLTADLDCSGYSGDALTLGANWVRLDLGGHTIWGPAGDEGYAGVNTNGYNRTTIQNGTIADYSTGVLIEGSRRTTVRDLDIEGEAGIGIGIGVDGGAYNAIKHVHIMDVETGIDLAAGNHQMVRYAFVAAEQTGVSSMHETADTYRHVWTMAPTGFYADSGKGNRYIANVANGGEIGFDLECDGDGKVFLTGNTASHNTGSGYSLDGCYDGAHIGGPGSGSRFISNVASGNGGTGFVSTSSNNEVWRYNTATDNGGDGFYLETPTGARVLYNTALRNAEDGFYIFGNSPAHNVDTFTYNRARRNDIGFEAEYVAPGHGNVARHNSTANCINVACI